MQKRHMLSGQENLNKFVNLTLSMVRLKEVKNFQRHRTANHLASNSYESGVFFGAIREIILRRTLVTSGSSV